MFYLLFLLSIETSYGVFLSKCYPVQPSICKMRPPARPPSLPAELSRPVRAPLSVCVCVFSFARVMCVVAARGRQLSCLPIKDETLPVSVGIVAGKFRRMY